MKLHVPANFIGYGTFAIAAMVAFAGLLRHRAGGPHEGLSAPARSRWPLEGLPWGASAGPPRFR